MSQFSNLYLWNDLQEFSDQTLIVNEIDFHPNEFAHKKVAEILIKKLNLCNAF